MSFGIQPVLENDGVILHPLREADFQSLYAVASDPKVWEQHPNKDRWKKDIFKIFFKGAMQSKGAFKITDKATGKIAGSTRIYDFNAQANSILIGYTFYAAEYWGTGVNHAVKHIMLDYLFQFVSQVGFHVGANNIRSQKAIGRLGAKKDSEQEIAYYGEISKLNYIYHIYKDAWVSNRPIAP